jgi:hypothetical protein
MRVKVRGSRKPTLIVVADVLSSFSHLEASLLRERFSQKPRCAPTVYQTTSSIEDTQRLENTNSLRAGGSQEDHHKRVPGEPGRKLGNNH